MIVFYIQKKTSILNDSSSSTGNQHIFSFSFRIFYKRYCSSNPHTRVFSDEMKDKNVRTRFRQEENLQSVFFYLLFLFLFLFYFFYLLIF